MGRIERMMVALLLIATGTVHAQWQSTLSDGGQVSVDPKTNRATLTRDGVTTPLWDGVHSLSDGSTLTVRAGQAVPNEAILKSRQQPEPPVADPALGWVGSPIVGLSPCEQLERRVCGVNGLCKEAEACSVAAQLLSAEQDERASGKADVMTYSSGRCMEALSDQVFFKACSP